MDATAEARRKKSPAKKRPGRGGGGGGRDPREGFGVSPAAPPEDAGGRGAALAECAVSCCVLCACLPVAALCCVARAPLRAARRCCCRWRRRPRRRLAPGGSSSFSDAEVGEFLPGGRGRAMGQQGEPSQHPARPRPRSRSPSGGRTTSPPACQPPLRDRRR
ncbi:hypothetical protein ACP70R_036968 [Stipagrostis hirtigluma subsp. patula]